MSTSDSYYAALVQDQSIETIPTFTLDSGTILTGVSVAYSTWGLLKEDRDNVLVICHALTGSSDASDWWRPLIGPGKALDCSRYFIFCANVLGSPYGSASPLSIHPGTGKPYGPTFPDTSIRDDVRIQKLVLDNLGVHSIAAVVGGSMGGMHTLEWPLCTPPGYVKGIIPIATSSHQGAWGISWGETQRQAICTDVIFRSGWYKAVPEGQPRRGMGLARMIGMLTYRSFESFETRFGRGLSAPHKQATAIEQLPTLSLSENGSTTSNTKETQDTTLQSQYSAQGYLQYQADKFLDRFDANCYLHLLKKMDTHDVTRGRVPGGNIQSTPTLDTLRQSLKTVPGGALVIGVQTDLLFPLQQQNSIAQCLQGATFEILESLDGHDGFLLQFEQLNKIIKEHLRRVFPQFYEGPARPSESDGHMLVANSVFGEVENVEL